MSVFSVKVARDSRTSPRPLGEGSGVRETGKPSSFRIWVGASSMPVRLMLASALCLFACGCTGISYYTQAVEGHLRLMAMARPISDVLDDGTTDPALRQQLEAASAIREFASRELALPDNRSYRDYADLGRPFVVWNVFAAPEFSVDLQPWCMLFIGCVNYRGYYDQSTASRYASELSSAGADTHVGGVPAYTTLGYFSDPLLNTFLRYGEQEVARIIFHELAHQIVYVKGDSAFNESFATAVENEGVRRWLARTATPERLRNYETQQERKAQFRQLVVDYRDKLRVLYASNLSLEAKRHAKTEVIAEMKETYAALKAAWGGFGAYDPWFSQPLNNATLGSVSLYTKWVPAFQALLEQDGGDLPRYYQSVARLADLAQAEREAALSLLLPKPAALKD